MVYVLPTAGTAVLNSALVGQDALVLSLYIMAYVQVEQVPLLYSFDQRLRLSASLSLSSMTLLASILSKAFLI
jgi:hypothetical protein